MDRQQSDDQQLNDELLGVAIDAAKRAGEILTERFGGRRVIEHKGRIDLVTDADKAAESAAISAIRERFPEHAILAEEGGGAGKSNYRWIIDPLDGTTNYAHAMPHFCVSVACEKDGKIEIGVILDPMRGELFTASRGAGAKLNDVTIAVSGEGKISEALLATGFPYWVQERPEKPLALFEAFVRRAQGVRRLGSAALDLAYLACGRYDGFFELALKPWDVAAGMLIVQEAGGLATGFDGGEIDLAQSEIDILGATPQLYGEILMIAIGALSPIKEGLGLLSSQHVEQRNK